MPDLVVFLRDRELSRVSMTRTRVTIGRDANCDVVIDNPGVSRTHAIVVYTDDQFRLRDAGSQNGITLNGEAASDAVIDYGDRIGIGKFQIELVENHTAGWELAAGTNERVTAPKNVMSTVQMDASTAARMRDEILRSGATTGADADDKPAPQKKRARKRPSAAGHQPAMQQLVPPEALNASAAGRSAASAQGGVPAYVWVVGVLGVLGLLALLIIRLT